MGFTIDDGKGSGRSASVSSVQRLNVSAKTNPRIFYISRDDGLSFTLVSIDAASAANDYICYLKNTDTTRILLVKRITISSDVDIRYKISSVTGTAAGSSELTPVNLNLSSGNVADATARGNGAITGLTEQAVISASRVAANDDHTTELEDALILGNGDAIAIEHDVGAAAVIEVNIEFHYETIGAV